MILYIRTEANRITATGHMMRCLAIADAAAAGGVESVFIVAEACSEKFPKERGYRTVCLNRRWDDFDGEIPVMEKLIAEKHIEILLIDSYFVSMDYMRAVSGAVKTAYIDDLHASVWPCSTLINYAIYYDLYDYEKEYPLARLLLGCSYAPLRKEFAGLPKKLIRQEVRKVLVVTGGTDEYHFIKQFIQSLLIRKEQFGGIEFDLVCGAYNQDLDAVRKIASDYEDKMRKTEAEEDLPHLCIYDALPDLKDVMTEADILITAGGTTLYEMAACGTPGICFSVADNQLDNVKGFARRGLVYYAGDIRGEFSYEGLLRMLKKLIQDERKRAEVSGRLRTLVDGKGAERLVEALLGI